MENLIIYNERYIKPKGAKKGIIPNAEKIKSYCFYDDYAHLTQLRTITTFSHTKATFLYPGCGADVLFPLLYMERLFPQLQEAKFMLVDIQDNQKLIETVLDDIGLPFSRDKERIIFYWKEIKVTIVFIIDNIFLILDSLLPFDIYFERAFRIIKEGHAEYEPKIIEKLAPGGILISDSGFQEVKLERIEVPKELSVYGEMVMGRKNS